MSGVDEEVEIPEFLDVMALPGIALFPGAFLPLYIFEPRYRKMLARALDGHRMFAVGQLPSNDDEAEVFPVGGAGLVRACVSNADGTSHLILQGVARVRFSAWSNIQACRHAKATVLESHNADGPGVDRLRTEIFGLCEKMGAKSQELRRMVEAFLERSHDPAEFADLVSATAVNDAAVRQRLMEELDVVNRLEILATYLARLAEEG